MAQASSTTTMIRFRCRARTAFCNHAVGAGHEDPQRRRVVDGGQVQHHQGAVQAEAGRGRPVEHAALPYD
jgi:hypothetical protein